MGFLHEIHPSGQMLSWKAITDFMISSMLAEQPTLQSIIIKVWQTL